MTPSELSEKKAKRIGAIVSFIIPTESGSVRHDFIEARIDETVAGFLQRCKDHAGSCDLVSINLQDIL